ncbi:hypothetical protein L9F63_000294 [Diploptera punctata]|uniref:Coiled-coil domain-containing protein 130 homolog n=1 Tax=Diploptera punctata TaxID=6984 RepID=A0AAD8AM23_DIPPU|nr:hypothetical protein L9F63_000294 [Diploptera punctata]
MGERKGTNHYYPPDYDPRKGGLNKFMGTHSLRERARKIHDGILIIRFELPFNVWCNGCGNHIGMGVRYNAEKRKIGNYFTVPIWSFRMKCHLCENYFEIKTEPKTHEYIIISGARRQENRWDPKQNEQILLEDKNLPRKLFLNPMFKLEHELEDKKQAQSKKSVLGMVAERCKIHWMNDYAANCALRKIFRENKEETVNFEEKEKQRVKRKREILQNINDSCKRRHMIGLLHKNQISSSITGNIRKKLHDEDVKYSSNSHNLVNVPLVSYDYNSTSSEDSNFQM